MTFNPEMTTEQAIALLALWHGVGSTTRTSHWTWSVLKVLNEEDR